MRYSIVTIVIFTLAFALFGCEQANDTDEVELEMIANNPPPDSPEEMKDAETAYTFLVENWVEGNFENVYLVMDGESKDYIGMAWDSYISAREIAYENFGAEAEAYFEETPHGEILKLEGIQQFFAYTINEAGSSKIDIDDEVKAEGLRISKTEGTEIESRPGVEAVTFESNYLASPLTLFKEGDYWVTDYWVGDCQDSIGQADIALTDVGNDMVSF